MVVACVAYGTFVVHVFVVVLARTIRTGSWSDNPGLQCQSRDRHGKAC